MSVDWERNQLLFRRLSRTLGKIARKPQPEAVHQFRTTARRLESVLGALAPEPSRNQRKLLKQIARVRSRAGKLRDVDVQIAALTTVKLTTETVRKQRLMKALAEMRSRREKKLLASLEARDVRRLRERLWQAAFELGISGRRTTAEAPVRAHPEPALDPVREALRRFAAMVREHSALTEETLHTYRIKGKRARYLAEMAGNDPTAAEIVAALKRMQDAIGDWHDWWALAGTAEKVFAEPQPCPFVLAIRNIMHARFDAAVRVSTEVRRRLLAMQRSLPKRAAAAAPPSTTAATA